MLIAGVSESKLSSCTSAGWLEWMEGVRAAMKTRHFETDQWLNIKELCLGSGRRRQLSQDRKDR
jgi:hypothetical protein